MNNEINTSPECFVFGGPYGDDHYIKATVIKESKATIEVVLREGLPGEEKITFNKNKDWETKHTPGPWKVSTPYHDYEIRGSDGFKIAQVGYPDDAGMSDQRREQEANARLIASAPRLLEERDELLSALKRLETAHSLLLSDRGCLDSEGMTEDQFEEVIHAGEIARAAIAKVGGTS